MSVPQSSLPRKDVRPESLTGIESPFPRRMEIPKEKIIAVIPARGGSKSIPKKNILPFRGKPLIVHSIEQALEAKRVGRVLVSTDSPEIREIVLQAGAEVPFLRPAEYAQDLSPDLDVFQHALRWLEREEGYRPELIVHLRPTSPLRPPGLIDEGIERLDTRPDADSLRTIVPAPVTPYKMWLLDGDFLNPLLGDPRYPEAYNLPRQLLPPVYWQNAYLDVTRWATVMEKNSMTGERILALVMESSEDVDIDTFSDLERIEPQPSISSRRIDSPSRDPRMSPDPSRCKAQRIR
jgi:CMP-N,N'-diacetyllegionaminic acid synthase